MTADHPLTNHSSLPRFWVRACEQMCAPRDRAGADYTVTELLRPAYQALLLEKYGPTTPEDVSLFGDRMLGVGVHRALEVGAKRLEDGAVLGGFSEVRLSSTFAGKVVSGATDQFELLQGNDDETFLDQTEGVLWDLKTCRVWAVTWFLKGRGKNEWEAQVNAYAELWRRAGFTPKALKILAVMKDWSFRDAERGDEGYPKHQEVVLEMPLWSPEKAVAFIEGRVEAHEKARRVGEKKTPICTPEERWAKEDAWAVHSFVGGEQSARAHRVFDTEAEAEAECEDVNRKQLSKAPSARKHYEVVFRKGEDTRCRPRFCRICSSCSYWSANGIKF